MAHSTPFIISQPLDLVLVLVQLGGAIALALVMGPVLRLWIRKQPVWLRSPSTIWHLRFCTAVLLRIAPSLSSAKSVMSVRPILCLAVTIPPSQTLSDLMMHG